MLWLRFHCVSALKEIPPSFVLSTRRSFTYEEVLGACEDVQLREQDFGNFQMAEEKLRLMAERKEFGRFFYRFPNGESGADVYDRITIFEDHFIRGINAGGVLMGIIVGHVSWSELNLGSSWVSVSEAWKQYHVQDGMLIVDFSFAIVVLRTDIMIHSFIYSFILSM